MSHAGNFKKGDPRTKALAVKGGKSRAAQRRQARGPYEGSILDMMDACGLTGETWAAWRVYLKAVFALPMDADELVTFTRHTEREKPPSEPVDESWMPVGRRGGKSRIAGLVALYLAIRFDVEHLAPGELVLVPVLAADRRQARAVLGYIRGFCELDEFRPFVARTLRDSVELRTGVNVEVHTASYRTTRGYTCIGVICDEVAFWRTEDGAANPDSEVLAALRPATATVPSALILGLSSPYAARGELYSASERYFGTDDQHVLVWNADTRSMNPDVPLRIIERAFEEDPVSAASEYGADGRVQFRRDVEAFLTPEAIRAVTVEGRLELTPVSGVRYQAFADPSGGSQDSFTLAIAHAEDERAVLDLVREVRPPFSPDDVVSDFADVLRTYGLRTATGDRYGAEWVTERFARHGIVYKPSERTKSDIYKEFVAPVNAGRVELLDIPALRAQLIGLERRVARGGRDSVDHAPGGRDDVANAAAGALGLFARRTSGKKAGLIR